MVRVTVTQIQFRKFVSQHYPADSDVRKLTNMELLLKPRPLIWEATEGFLQASKMPKTTKFLEFIVGPNNTLLLKEFESHFNLNLIVSKNTQISKAFRVPMKRTRTGIEK